jgi:hypothetical protein
MPKLTYTWRAVFETEVEVENPSDEEQVLDSGNDIDPEVGDHDYQTLTFEVLKVTDEDGNKVKHPEL